ncbi:hypothetical protein ACNS7O_01715 [Haloferacaceae archaeon DSL9]
MRAPLFEETQRFPSRLIVGLLVLTVPTAVLLSVSLLEDFGSFEAAAVPLAVAAVSLGAPIALVYGSSLRVRVTDDAVSVRFVPFHVRARRIPAAEIRSIRRADPRSLGYGLQWTRRGWEYTVDGGGGVLIERTNGKPVFIGSNRRDDLCRAIETAVRNAKNV